MNLLYDERFAPAEISHRVQSIGQRISGDFPESQIVLIAILKGAAIFASAASFSQLERQFRQNPARFISSMFCTSARARSTPAPTRGGAAASSS